MTTRLQSDESFTLGVRRLLLEAIDRLAKETDVHEVRLACKQVRAWLRLLRGAMDKSAFQRENLAFRNIGRRFRAARDSKTLQDTIAGLEKAKPDRIDDDIAGRLLGAVMSSRRVVTMEDMDRAFAQTRTDAEAAKARIGALSLGKADIAKALTLTWRRNVHAWRRVKRKTGQDKTLALHEWRKQAKHLRYQLQILRDAWPKILDRLDRRLEKLTTQLGDDHDLAMLEQALDSLKSSVPADSVLPLIARERRGHQRKAARLAEQLYGRKTKAFADAAERHWQAWRQ